VTKKIFVLGLIALLSAICFTSNASAQTSWWRTYGGPHDDEANSVQQTTDGGYIVAGYTVAGEYLVKTNTQGDTLWTKTYVDSGLIQANSVQQVADGGYVIAGTSGRVNLIKTSAQGDSLWTRTYGHGSGNSVQQTTDGGYIIAGWFNVGNGGVYLIRTDSSGDTLWTRIYGGTNGDWAYSVQQTTDGGYIITGGANLYGVENGDVYLIKTSAQGDTLWTRTYGGTNREWCYSVQQTTDGGYIVAGYTESFGAGGGDVYLIKTDSSGDTLWTRTYGGTSLEVGTSVQQTTDGGYVIAGYTRSFGPGTDRDNVYLIKTSAQGDTLWTRTYGGTNDDWGNSVQQTTDGGYIVAGVTKSFGAGTPDYYNVYLIKTDANGSARIEEPLTPHPIRPASFLVQPSPFTSFARVPGHETDVFVLSDVTGRQVAVCGGDRVGEGLRPGVYFLSSVGGRAGKAATATIVKTAF
jgi:hypothetical protein